VITHHSLDEDKFVDECEVSQEFNFREDITAHKGFVFGSQSVGCAAGADDLVTEPCGVALPNVAIGLAAPDQITHHGEIFKQQVNSVAPKPGVPRRNSRYRPGEHLESVS
jgi:hypothetical protein